MRRENCPSRQTTQTEVNHWTRQKKSPHGIHYEAHDRILESLFYYVRRRRANLEFGKAGKDVKLVQITTLRVAGSSMVRALSSLSTGGVTGSKLVAP